MCLYVGLKKGGEGDHSASTLATLAEQVQDFSHIHIVVDDDKNNASSDFMFNPHYSHDHHHHHPSPSPLPPPPPKEEAKSPFHWVSVAIERSAPEYFPPIPDPIPHLHHNNPPSAPSQSNKDQEVSKQNETQDIFFDNATQTQNDKSLINDDESPSEIDDELSVSLYDKTGPALKKYTWGH